MVPNKLFHLKYGSNYSGTPSSERVSNMMLKGFNYFHLLTVVQRDPMESIPGTSASFYIGLK